MNLFIQPYFTTQAQRLSEPRSVRAVGPLSCTQRRPYPADRAMSHECNVTGTFGSGYALRMTNWPEQLQPYSNPQSIQ